MTPDLNLGGRDPPYGIEGDVTPNWRVPTSSGFAYDLRKHQTGFKLGLTALHPSQPMRLYSTGQEVL